MAVANIHEGKQKKIYLGNLNAKRDWGFAGDYVEGMWRMLQQEEPDDFVLATGRTVTVREFVEMSFKVIGDTIHWEGEGVDEKGYRSNGDCVVEVHPDYFRPTEVELLLGDPSKAKAKLGWEPQVDLEGLCQMMVKHDLDHAKR